MTTTKELMEIASNLEDITEHEWTSDELYRVPNSPGKFEGEPILTRILYELKMNGMEDGDIDFGEGDDYSLFDHCKLKGVPPISGILSEDSRGFIYLREYSSRHELAEAWKELEKSAQKATVMEGNH